jgi:hypothetical protein
MIDQSRPVAVSLLASWEKGVKELVEACADYGVRANSTKASTFSDNI